MAMIHLYSHGYEGEDLLDFTLKLSNPSTIAQQQKLELISSRFDIAGKAPEGIVDRRWVRKNIMGLSDEDIENIKEGRKKDKQEDAELEAQPGPEGAGGTGGGGDGGGEAGGPPLTAGYEREGEIVSAGVTRPPILSIENEDLPLRAEKTIRNVFGKDVETKRDRSTAASIEMPDMFKMAGVGSWARDQDTSNRVFDEDELYSMATEAKKGLSLMDELYNEAPFSKPKMTPQLGATLKQMRTTMVKERSSLLSEDIEILSNSGSADE
jgi:hypothetical protein